jgi:hypothetical protein
MGMRSVGVGNCNLANDRMHIYKVTESNAYPRSNTNEPGPSKDTPGLASVRRGRARNPYAWKTHS